MSRPKIQPEYNAEKVMKELINAVAESYEETGRNTNTGNAINTGNGYTENGDDTHMLLWILLAAVGMAGVVSAVWIARKRNKNQLVKRAFMDEKDS